MQKGTEINYDQEEEQTLQEKQLISIKSKMYNTIKCIHVWN